MMTTITQDRFLCGLWFDDAGNVHLVWGEGADKRWIEHQTFKPFVWLNSEVIDGTITPSKVIALKGTGILNQLVYFKNASDYAGFLGSIKEDPSKIEVIKPLEHQFLLANDLRFFDKALFSSVRRLQFDIETVCQGPHSFSNAKYAKDRVLAIGMRFQGADTLLELEAMTDEAEKKLLHAFNHHLQTFDPDTIEGHNIFNFDLDYLRKRCERFDMPCLWGREGTLATFRRSRIKVAERWVDFSRCDIPGRTVFDTYLIVQLFDLTERALTSYGLKKVALALGITDPDTHERTYLQPEAIQKTFSEDRPLFRKYLIDDLRESEGLADFLLPTYLAEVKNFPLTLQEACLRGRATKLEFLFLEKYYHSQQSLPLAASIDSFEGGFTKSFCTGVFKNVLHFDVASLYPSLILLINKNPKNDTLGIFIPLLEQFRTYRLKYKELARSTADTYLRREYQARQSSFKILINSFYGYLGFEGGARFADAALASEITANGRKVLQDLIEAFQALGCEVLEADTDGIYLASADYYDQPQALLAKISQTLPSGIELEFDGAYPGMFCYKAKNYALYDGKQIITKGSALRSRGTEPFLRRLTDHLIAYLLGKESTTPCMILDELRESIKNQTLPVDQVAKSETINQSPERYEKEIESGKKVRRASLEVAIRMQPKPRLGEKVIYFITPSTVKKAPDWQQARPIEAYNPQTLPYDSIYYLKKLNEWEKRYSVFFKEGTKSSYQLELI